MAFKMRSGNKVSFKNMGGSPAKQTVDYAAGLTGGEDIRKRTEARILEQKYAEEQRKLRRAMISNMPTDEERREENIQEERESRKDAITGEIGKKLIEGVDFKSKEKLKQEKKTRKTESKTNEDVEDRKILGINLTGLLGKRKYTKAERAADKTKTLEDRAKRERGTGESKGRVNWKKYFLSGDAATSVEHDAKYKSTEKKIAKRKTKAEAEITKKRHQEKREEMKPGTVVSRLLGLKGSKKWKKKQGII